MIVADASMVVAGLLDRGASGRWAESWIMAGPVIGPELLPAEVSNTLRRLELSRRISSFEANAAHGDLLRLSLRLFPFEPLAHRIWKLRQTLTSYDAWYVALAEASDCPLVTLDVRLSRADGPECPILVPTD